MRFVQQDHQVIMQEFLVKRFMMTTLSAKKPAQMAFAISITWHQQQHILKVNTEIKLRKLRLQILMFTTGMVHKKQLKHLSSRKLSELIQVCHLFQLVKLLLINLNLGQISMMVKMYYLLQFICLTTKMGDLEYFILEQDLLKKILLMMTILCIQEEY